jgi:hypothetical protein
MSQTEVQLIKSSSVVDGDIVGMSSSKLSGALPAISGASLTNLPASGITMVDNWYVNGSFSVPSGEATITANWTRGTSDQFGSIGSAMTQSSGVFTFPSTGIYYCSINGGFYRGTGYRRYIGWTIKTTSDNSSYSHAVINYDSISGDTNSNVSAAVSATCVFDVTDTSTHKMTFQTDASDSGASVTSVSSRALNVVFIRLGDT